MFSEYLAEQQVLVALSFGGLVVAFILGATIAAFAVQIGQSFEVRSVFALIITAEAGIILALGAATLTSVNLLSETALVIVLSFVMGLQNALTTMISQTGLRTTHVSGTATDIGIELAALTGPKAARHFALPKLLLHSLTLLCFVMGGVAGAILFTSLGAWLFVIAATVLLATALPHLIREPRH